MSGVPSKILKIEERSDGAVLVHRGMSVAAGLSGAQAVIATFEIYDAKIMAWTETVESDFSWAEAVTPDAAMNEADAASFARLSPRVRAPTDLE
jgi:hypothetical protein